MVAVAAYDSRCRFRCHCIAYLACEHACKQDQACFKARSGLLASKILLLSKAVEARFQILERGPVSIFFSGLTHTSYNQLFYAFYGKAKLLDGN